MGAKGESGEITVKSEVKSEGRDQVKELRSAIRELAGRRRIECTHNSSTELYFNSGGVEVKWIFRG